MGRPGFARQIVDAERGFALVGARQLRRVEEELCREYEPGSPFRAATLVKITRDRIDLGAEPLGMAALQADRELLLRSPNQLLAAELELVIGESLFVLGKVEAARKSLARGLTMKPSAAARERALRVLAKIDGR